MDRFEAMSVFVAAVETGSLTAAGKRLDMPLPTVSRKLAELEAHLGTHLLTRTTRRLTLTDAGRAYYQASERILDEIAVAERTAAGEQSAPRGDLSVTAPIAFGRLHVLPIISEFLALYPEINIRLSLSDRNADLLEDQIDLAVRIGVLPDSSMVATRIGEVRRVVCASPAFLREHGMLAAPADLAGKPAIVFEGPGQTAWTFAGGAKGRQRSVEILPRLSVNTAEAALDAAADGVGVTRVLSYQAAAAVGRGDLEIVLADFEPVPLPVYLLHQAQGTLPFKMRIFLDFAAPWLRRRIAAIFSSI